MRSIAIMNQKGGVGKTTTAVNLAAAVSNAGQRVCLIDLDPQAHASLHLGLSPGPDQSTVYDVLTAGRTMLEARQQINENLWIVPAELDLAAAELELVTQQGREVIVRDRLAEDHGSSFDYLIIDCPPSLGVLTLNALTAVDEVLLPLQPHFLALHGLSKLLGTIEIVADRWNNALRLNGVVLCMYDSATRLAAEVGDDVAAFFATRNKQHQAWAEARVLDTKIRRNIRLAEAPSYGQSIFDYAPHSHGAEDYEQLAHELLSQVDPALVSRAA